MTNATTAVGHDEVAALKTVALRGGLGEPVKVSCATLGERLDASSQTASRRLQRLEAAGLLDRDVVGDGQWVTVTDEGERRLRGEYADYRRLFEGEDGLALPGTITSGMGEGRHYIQLSGYHEQFVERLGYEPFPGTLNVSLSEAAVRARAGLDSVAGVPIDGWEDDDRTFGPATCYAAELRAAGGAAEPTHVIVPERTHHDEDQLEVIAPVKLREELDIDDGDEVRVHVTDAERTRDPTAPAGGAATDADGESGDADAADDGGSA